MVTFSWKFSQPLKRMMTMGTPFQETSIYGYILGKSFRPVSVENDQQAESRKHTKNSIFIRSVKNRKSPFSPKNILFCHFHAHRQTWDFGFSGFPAKWWKSIFTLLGSSKNTKKSCFCFFSTSGKTTAQIFKVCAKRIQSFEKPWAPHCPPPWSVVVQVERVNFM